MSSSISSSKKSRKFSSTNSSKLEVGVIMGSISDKRIMTYAVEILKDFKVKYEWRVVSAHRTPQWMQEYALDADSRGIQVIIAGAGGAAHLPGMVASLTSIPVIGVPISLKHFSGLDSLLSIVSMPKGVPVATVAVDGSANAALLAIRILALNSPTLAKKLYNYRSQAAQTSCEQDQNLLNI